MNLQVKDMFEDKKAYDIPEWFSQCYDQESPLSSDLDQKEVDKVDESSAGFNATIILIYAV